MYSKDPPPYLTREKLMDAARASAATWSYPQVDCTSMMLTVVELDETEAPVAYDKFNRITFRRDRVAQDALRSRAASPVPPTTAGRWPSPRCSP